MLTKRTTALALVGLAGALLGMPAPAHACRFLDCLFGRSQSNSVAQTTYAPAYYGPTAASYAPASYAPNMNCCASPIATYSPQTCYYAPETHYKVLNRPILTALFGPQLAPVTTYRLTCSSTCAPSMAYAPAASYMSGASSYSAPVVSSGCCGSALSPTQSYIAPEPAPYVSPETALPQNLSPQNASPQNVVPRTFGPADVQPSLPPVRQESLKPIPDGNTRLESAPGPRLVDPDNRTTWRPVRHAVYQVEATEPADPKIVEVRWQPATR